MSSAKQATPEEIAAYVAKQQAKMAAELPPVEVEATYDEEKKMVYISFPYDATATYRINPKTEKTRAVATSHGNVTVAGTRGLKVGVNAFLPK